MNRLVVKTKKKQDKYDGSFYINKVLMDVKVVMRLRC